MRSKSVVDAQQIATVDCWGGQGARTLCTLTDIAGQANGCIARVGAGGSSCIDCGIREGIRVLLHGRRNSQAAGPLNEVMVVFSDGGNNLGCDPVLAAARQAKFNGILVVTVCVGPDCAAQCLSQVASSARYFFTVDDAGRLIAVFERIRQDLVPIFRIKATVLHTLPADMAYVPGSAVPAAEVSPAGDQLKWTTDAMMLDGITLTLRLRPRLAGRHPVSVETTAEITDAADRKLTVTFPIAWITVLQPFAAA